MKSRTKISWSDFTMNPWEGCTKVSAGCRFCYAEARNERYAAGVNWGKGAPRRKSLHAVTDLATINRRFGPVGDLTLLEDVETLERWIHGKEPAPETSGAVRKVAPQVFSLSLGDILDPEIDPAWLAEWLTAVAAAPHLQFLLLTKRPELFWKRMAEADATADETATLAAIANFRTGLPNVAWGTSVEDATNRPRILGLADIPAAARFISCEPLLGDPQLWKAFHEIADGTINLVISGGESGAQARPMHPAWIDSIQRDCEDFAIPHHFKQWGTWGPAQQAPSQDANQDNPGNKVVINRDGTMTTEPSVHGWQTMVRTASKTAVKPLIKGLIQQPRLVFPQP
jgi:protein gp37